MIEEMLFAGFGGQGILLAGQLVAKSAMDDGLYATWFPSYGPEMRGGTANCIVVYSDDEIGSPITSQYDTVIVLNQPSFEKFQPTVKPGGTLLVNTSLIEINNPRDDIKIVEVQANRLAQEVATDRSANVVIVGAYNALKGHLKNETIAKVLQETFARKGQNVVDANLKALTAGTEAIAGVKTN
ncbi:MAG: 2-oxoacid:acceptor oxidoreductase family protein [Phycisphaerae bacterium]|nr:2-oxoacid:acceptor oxidoreductase family protein [Phycisphaerae bacterium]